LARIYNAKNTLEHLAEKGGDEPTERERISLDGLDKYRERFIDAMDDDLNTADAIAVLFELIAEVNGVIRDGASKAYAKAALALLTELARVPGLLEKEENASADEEDASLKALIDERQKAREAKDFARADEIRDMLKAKGITLKDTPQGVQMIRDN
jgi:cysteinyl-tRNA synthetase